MKGLSGFQVIGWGETVLFYLHTIHVILPIIIRGNDGAVGIVDCHARIS